MISFGSQIRGHRCSQRPKAHASVGSADRVHRWWNISPRLPNCSTAQERLEMLKAGMKLKHLWNKSSNNASKWRNTMKYPTMQESLTRFRLVDLRVESAASASFPSHEWFRQVPSKSSMNGTDGTIPIWNHQTDWRWSHDDFSFIWFHTPKSPICPTDWRTWQSTGGPPKQSTPLGHGEVCFNGPTHHFPFSWLGVRKGW